MLITLLYFFFWKYLILLTANLLLHNFDDVILPKIPIGYFICVMLCYVNISFSYSISILSDVQFDSKAGFPLHFSDMLVKIHFLDVCSNFSFESDLCQILEWTKTSKWPTFAVWRQNMVSTEGKWEKRLSSA